MRILRQKIFFERTKEMKETAENFRNFKNNVVSGISDTVKNPGKIGKKIKNQKKTRERRPWPATTYPGKKHTPKNHQIV